jgi:3alpha(or 20beta)-hydroxysteroid dehydrogenase
MALTGNPRAGRLEGKVALITGGAGGIGAAIARRFAAEGARVLITDVEAGAASELAEQLPGGAGAHGLDVTSESGWEDILGWALATCGRIEVLVNNAGLFLAASLTDTTLEDFRRLQEVNQVGVFLGMRTIAPAMAARGGGSIINVSSIAGVTGSPYLTAYAAGKWAVRGMTRTAAKELASSGVRVNSLHPGQIDTDMHTRQRERTPELIQRLVASIPMRRIGDPSEVADAAVFLASEESRYMTGSEIVIDGGASA